MRIISVRDIKDHARIDGYAEDNTLELYGESAEETILNMLNRSFEDLIEEYGCVPAPIRHACLMLAAHSFNHREPASPQNLFAVPYTFDALIKPYMKLT